MTKTAVKCSHCGVGVKIDVGSDEKAETSVMCRPWETERKMEEMVAAQVDLVKRIGELENKLEWEREVWKAIGEMLKAAEEKLFCVAGAIQKSSEVWKAISKSLKAFEENLFCVASAIQKSSEAAGAKGKLCTLSAAAVASGKQTGDRIRYGEKVRENFSCLK